VFIGLGFSIAAGFQKSPTNQCSPIATQPRGFRPMRQGGVSLSPDRGREKPLFNAVDEIDASHFGWEPSF
jgi:hypothetical protein